MKDPGAVIGLLFGVSVVLGLVAMIIGFISIVFGPAAGLTPSEGRIILRYAGSVFGWGVQTILLAAIMLRLWTMKD